MPHYYNKVTRSFQKRPEKNIWQKSNNYSQSKPGIDENLLNLVKSNSQKTKKPHTHN
jgi:hypothetical protein